MSTQNSKGRKKSLVAGVVTLALGSSALIAPHTAEAETKTNLNQPLACNLQLKNPGAIPLGQADAVEGVYNAGNSQYNNFQIKLANTTAPDTVEQGKEFDYVIDAGTLQIPGVIKAAVTANVSRVSQLNLWYQLPENAELVSIKQQGGVNGVKAVQEGNRVRVWIPAPEQGSKDVTAWTKTGKGDYAHGGASASQAGSVFNYPMPKITLRLKATGAPGSTIQAGFPKVDADKFGSDLPIQFYADASAKVLFSNISANGFIRCGLSEDDTYWPEKKNGTNVPSDKFSAVTITAPAKKSDNETYDPKAAGAVTITEGDALPDAQDQIADFANLPAGTTAAWSTEHKTAGQGQKGQITVTYPDKSTDKVDVTVNVNKKKTQAETNDPKAAGAVTITEGDALPKAQDQIADFANLPAGTTAAWSTEHKTAGQGQKGQITVTYPDKSTDKVDVTVNVNKKETLADKNTPEAKGPVTVTEGKELPKAEDQIKDFASLPAGTTAAWASEHTTVGGNQNGRITVTYSDGSTDTVELAVNVKAQWKPQPTSNIPTVKVGTDIPADAAKRQIGNAAQAPERTTFEWGTAPDTTTAGAGKTATVKVTVPGETPVEVEVKYNVTEDEVAWQPEVDEAVQQLKVGDEVKAPEEYITNKGDAPAGTTYEWVEEPDTSTAGEKNYAIKVTADGEEHERTVKFNVVAVYAPKAKDEATEIEQGADVRDEDAKAQIANADEAPFGTTFTWKTKPATTEPGEVTGVVTVTVPEGEPQDVEVKYTVKEKQAPAYEPQAKDAATEVEQNAAIADDDAKAQIANAEQAPEGTKFTWKTKPDTTEAGEKTGVVTVTVPGKDPKDVEVKYTVKEKKTDGPTDPETGEEFTPKAKETPTEVEQNATIADDDAKAQIADADKAPEGTTFTWKSKPDTTTAGEKTGVVTVTVPGKDPQDIEVKYTVKKKDDPTGPTDPNPGQPTAKSVVVKPLGVKPGDQVTVNVNGTEQTYTVDAEGKIVITEGLPTDGKPFDVSVVKVGDDKGSSVVPTKWKVNLEKGTAVPVGAVVGSIIAVAAVALSFIPIPGLKDAITNIQKQMGIFNPALAGQVEKAQPVIGSLAGFAILAAILVPVIKAIVKVEDTK